MNYDVSWLPSLSSELIQEFDVEPSLALALETQIDGGVESYLYCHRELTFSDTDPKVYVLHSSSHPLSIWSEARTYMEKGGSTWLFRSPRHYWII